MNISQIQPIINEPVLFLNNEKILVIADLHIGIDSELKNYGISQTDHTQNMIKHILLICEKQKPKKIILLGDIKHNIPNTSYYAPWAPWGRQLSYTPDNGMIKLKLSDILNRTL